MSTPPVFPAGKNAVLLVAESLRPGGLVLYTRGLYRGLAGAGLAPRLIAPEAPAPGLFTRTEEAELRVFPGLLGGVFRPFVFRRLAAWAREERFALVHGLSAFAAPACQRVAAALDLPYLVSVHYYQNRGDLRVDRHCRGILACSEPIRENLVNDARVPKELIQVLPPGIEIPPAPAAPPPSAERLPLVATFAALTPPQDVATFIRAAESVSRARNAACQFLIVGDGPEESALRRLARRLRLEKQLTFAHVAVPHERILPEVDVYLQTPRREGFGMAVLEAMAFARPVVATAAGGLLTLIRDGQTGFLVPAGDAAAVAEKTLDLLGDPVRRANMGAQGRAQVLSEFSLSRMIEETVALYASVIT